MSLDLNKSRFINRNDQDKKNNIVHSLSIRRKQLIFENRGTAQYTCPGILTIEAAVVLPFFVCFLVFILHFFRILQVQAGISQALQLAGRQLAAEYSIQTEKYADHPSAEGPKTTEGAAALLGLVRAKLLFKKQLKKQNCPVKYIRYGTDGISLLQSDFSDSYVELKAVYHMKLPVELLGDVQYRIVQTAKCRKWTGFQLGQDEQEDDTWLYYTEHGTVYHASRNCSYLDLSIRGVTFGQADSSRNKNGGKYHKCEKCGSSTQNHTMVYITDYGDRYHSSLTCSGLKRSVYMIRRSKATEKRMCRKCG